VFDYLIFDTVNTFTEHLNQLRVSKSKALAVLIDPDKMQDEKSITSLMDLVNHSKADFVFVGGSLMVTDHFHESIRQVKRLSKVPVILFPGSPAQISNEADAILFLSLISGRNADLLIGQHVIAAPILKRTSLEIVPTGYMLVDCGKATTATYISNTFPLPYDKPEIAAATAMAGEMLGLKCMYLDGGSGAEKPVSPAMISAVKRSVNLPVIVGGGIRHEDQARDMYNAGADLLVIGTAFEEEPELLFSLAQSRFS
jgi:phosphoglycerol geranylgeranyltransferase